MTKRVVLVTGMGGSKTWGPALKKYYESQGYEVDMIPYDQYDAWTYRNHDLHVGHSLGAMRIQASFTPQNKIHTWGAPQHFRGRMMNDFIQGHMPNPNL